MAAGIVLLDLLRHGSMMTSHRAVAGRKAAARLVAREARDSENPARRLRASVIGADHRDMVLRRGADVGEDG